VTLEPRWLVETFKQAGLTPAQAELAGGVALRKLIRRQRSTTEPRPDAQFRSALTADPLVSVNRILGLGDSGLPFYDEWTGRLSEVDVTRVLTEIGFETSVALAFAKVVIEASSPEEWFEPVWTALGREGPVRLDELRRSDWSALRSEGDRMLPPLDPGPPPRRPRSIAPPPSPAAAKKAAKKKAKAPAKKKAVAKKKKSKKG